MSRAEKCAAKKQMRAEKCAAKKQMRAEKRAANKQMRKEQKASVRAASIREICNAKEERKKKVREDRLSILTAHGYPDIRNFAWAFKELGFDKEMLGKKSIRCEFMISAGYELYFGDWIPGQELMSRIS